MAVPMPRPATSVASVTRNGVIRSTTTQKALIAPNKVPVSSPAVMAAATPQPLWNAGFCMT
jgi:hypothetical protein